MGGRQSTQNEEDMQVVVQRPRVKAVPTDEKITGLTRLLTTENKKRKETIRDEFDHHEENMAVLKQLYKKMDPAIMRTSTFTTHGELQLSFKYEPTRELLLVKVIKARDLEARDLRGKTCQPYVKLFLYPATENVGEKKTQIAKKTLTPSWHEIFAFEITDTELQTGKLIAQVWDHDQLDQDDLLGETIIGLPQFDFSIDPVYTGWYTLKAQTDLDIGGDLEISLKFKMPQTLRVTVHRGNNLTNRYEEGAPNPFVKMQIPGTPFVYETEIQTDTTEPVWEQTFECKIGMEEFNSRYIIFHCIDFDDSGKNESLGQVIIELGNFDPDAGYHGSFHLADLSNTERLRTKWFQHATVQEFRESLVSHAAFKYPKFMFGQQQGNKVFKVTCKKAGAEARIRVVNGIPVY